MSFSSFLGSRFSGGRHLTMFVMKMSSLFKFMCASISLRMRPAAPTKGRPCSSSFLPGASPINIMSALGFPVPGTVLVRSWASGQFLQMFIFLAISSRTFLLLCATIICCLGLNVGIVDTFCGLGIFFAD